MAQTVPDETNPVPKLALQSVIKPALKAHATTIKEAFIFVAHRFAYKELVCKVERFELDNEGTKKDFKSSIERLIQSFVLAEESIPGISQEILAGILRADGYSMNINEVLLRCSYTDTDDFQIERQEPAFVRLERKANELKAILGKIPDEIKERAKFLQTIKDIASAIKELLDSVNQVLKTYQDQGRVKEYRKTLEQHKREFVKYSKNFSDTLKQYFKDVKQDSVFLSANLLINQTNNILEVFRMVSRD